MKGFPSHRSQLLVPEVLPCLSARTAGGHLGSDTSAGRDCPVQHSLTGLFRPRPLAVTTQNTAAIVSIENQCPRPLSDPGLQELAKDLSAHSPSFHFHRNDCSVLDCCVHHQYTINSQEGVPSCPQPLLDQCLGGRPGLILRVGCLVEKALHYGLLFLSALSSF